jgi:hypothetical protein
MALLKGKGAMTGVNLIARIYHNAKTHDGKTHYADVQIDARDPRGPEQTNLHLRSERVKGEDGAVRYNNGAPYSVGQIAEIVKAAGPNTEPIRDKDGNRIGAVYGFAGNVMPATRGTGLVVNTKSLRPSQFKVDGQTLDAQFASMRTAREAREAARQAQAGAPDPGPVAEPVAEQAEVTEPAVGCMLAPAAREQILGHAEIREVFSIPKAGKIAGCRVIDGLIRRGARLRLLRDDVVIHEGALGSLRRFKEDVREVREGFECGIGLEGYNDIRQNDVIEAYEVQEVARTL